MPVADIKAVAGVTAIDANVNVTLVTVKVAGGEVTPFKLAVMSVVPAVKPVAKPAIGLAATAGVAEFQVEVAVTSTFVVPSL